MKIFLWILASLTTAYLLYVIRVSFDKTEKIKKDPLRKDYYIIPTLFISINIENGEKWRAIGIKWLRKSISISMFIEPPKDED